MDIGNALRRAGRDDITLRSTIANTVGELYTHEVSIKSVKIHGKKIIISTGNPLINSELSLLSGDIKKASLQKLSKLGIHLSQETQFLFN